MALLQQDVEASIVNQTKKKFNVTFIKLLSFEVKVDKCEPKVVVLPQHGHRFMIFSNKNPSKLEYSFHYLDIKSLESKTPQELRISYGDGKQIRLLSATKGEEVEEILLKIGAQLKSTFPLLSLESLIPKIDLTPGERMTTLTKQLDAIVVSDHSACSGFSRMYVCVCDLYGYSLVEEIIWDLDTIYLSHDSRTLYLRDFDHLAVRVTDHHTVSRDHVPLLGALQFNEWFSGLDASNMRMTAEALAEILKVTRKNNSLTTLNLASTGLKSDFLQKFSSALSSNLTSKIVSLNLSGNILEDKGISYLSEAISNMVHGMQSLDLAQCSIGNKGVNRLMESISSNHIMANTLCTLYLSGNNLKGDELRALYNFLAQPNVLQKLDLSDTETPLEPLFTALTRGSTQHMEELNVSGNPFTNKKSKDGKPSSSWKQFFSSALVLSKLNMSNTRLPAPALKDLLTGLSSNVNKPLVYLDLSCNDLRSEGGMVLGSCVANLQNIHGLDLSDNGLDVNLTEILPWFGKNGTIHHLSIGKNFSQLRNKALQQALEGLVRAIQDEHCALESLSIADSKLRLDTTVIINALGSNSTLKSLDISGNQIGDIGAKMLAKALTINSTLTSVTWDRNNITAAGLRDVSQALQRNMTMLEMPLPIFDIAASVRINPDMIHSASMQIQTCLQRNHAPKKINYDQCYRLQQGFLVSSAQTIIDKKVRNIHIILNSLCESDSLSPEEFAQTNKLLADADRAKQILMALQAVVSKCEEPPNKFSDSIKQVTHTLTGSVNNQLEQVRLDMLKMVSQECNSVVASKETESMLESGAQSRGQLSPSEIGGLIDRHFVSDIQNKLSLLNFNMAFYIAEEVIEKVVDLLQAKYKELKTLKRGTLESTATIQSTQSEGAVDVNEELADSISPTLGMTYLGDTHENRMSVMKTLKRRPQSILVKSPEETNREFTGAMNSQSGADDQTEQTDAADGKTDDGKDEKPAEAVTTSLASPAAAAATGVVAAEPEIKNLPEVKPTSSLVHLAKDRPKRVKKQAARRPVPKAALTSDEADESAVDDFFKPAAVSQTPVLVSAPPPTAKPRTGSLDKSEGAAKAEKPDGSPKLKAKLRSPFGGSHKDKQDSEKKKGSRTSGAKKNIADSITNFFNKKKKPSLSAVDVPDTKPVVEATPTPPAKRDRSPNPPTSAKPSNDIPDESMSEANKTASLERAPTMETMSTSVTAETSEEQGALIPPKKKPMGVGMPGMPGMPGGLLAEMQKRNNKTALQPKAAPRSSPSVVKTEDTRPALKPATPSPTSEGKKEGVVPPVRPTPPKPQPAPREASTSTEPSPAVKPSKPPLLRPKPPPKLKPKPSANTRPTTMMDMSTTGISKTAPPKPPPPDPSKRQTYIAPKITSSADSSPLTSPELNTDKPSRPPRSSADFHIKQHDTAATAVPGADAALLSPSAKSPRPARPPSISFKSSAEGSGSAGTKSPNQSKSPLKVLPSPVSLRTPVKDVSPCGPVSPATPVCKTEANLDDEVTADDAGLDGDCTDGTTAEEESKLKTSVSQGDLTEGIGSAPKDTSVKVSPNTKGSAEEAAAISRGGNRSQSLKVSNGSATEETLSSPLFQSANVEDGPVLQPPSKSLKQAPVEKTADTTEVIQEDSGDESVV